MCHFFVFLCMIRECLFQSSLDSFRFFLVAGFVEQGEHILLVRLHARLVERIDTEDVTGYTAGTLEEVNELTDVILVQALEADMYVRYTAIDVCQTCAEFSHLVDFVHTLAGEEVQTIEVLAVAGDTYFLFGSVDRDNRLEDITLTFLYPLTH